MPVSPSNAAQISMELEGGTAIDALRWCYARFNAEKIRLSTSFGAEGMVLIHMLVNLVKNPRVFTIDTGRNFPETYTVWQEAVSRYGVAVDAFHPDPDDLRELTRSNGPNLFFNSVADRKQCCFIRKIKPLTRALHGADVWITGIRRSQSESRGYTAMFSYIEQYGVYKFCPLCNWTDANVWEYIRNNGVPYNTLYDKGYPTIGCEPCCRPVGPAQDMRAGRWWWEEDPHKECGIHIHDGKIARGESAGTFSI
jgi:phosphoadenosine phosphosulfate reductase